MPHIAVVQNFSSFRLYYYLFASLRNFHFPIDQNANFQSFFFFLKFFYNLEKKFLDGLLRGTFIKKVSLKTHNCRRSRDFKMAFSQKRQLHQNDPKVTLKVKSTQDTCMCCLTPDAQIAPRSAL